jgi:hypothetical protein
MGRLLLPAVLACLLAAQEDPATRVRPLVDQLASDDVQASDEALAALVKLGPPALDAIRAEHAKATGDTRLRLESAIKQIERNARRDRAMGPPVRVTLKASGRPLKDVVDELRDASGQPIVAKDLPADRVTVAFDRAPFWEALDGLCKAHGGIMWRVRGAEIRLEKRPYRALPRVVHGNLMVALTELTASTVLHRGGASGNAQLIGLVAWTKGTRPERAAFDVQALEDDKGTNLLGQREGWWSGPDREVPGDSLSRALSFWHPAVPDDAAQKLAKCKGTVTVSFVLERKKAIGIANPAGAKGTTHTAGALSFTLRDFTTSKGAAVAAVELRVRGKDGNGVLVGPGDITLVDREGKAHRARVRSESWGADYDWEGTSTTAYYSIGFSLPENAEIASLDVAAPADVEEVVIPFDFKDLPLK